MVTPTQPVCDVYRFVFAVDACARIAGSLGGGPVVMVTVDLDIVRELVLGTLGLLNTQDVRLLVLDVRQTTLLQKEDTQNVS